MTKKLESASPPEAAPTHGPVRSFLVHCTVFGLVLILGPLATVLCPFTRGQVIFWAGWLWSRIILKVSGVHLVIRGRENMAGERSRVIVANHASNFDIYVMIIALIGHTYRIVCKKELQYIPIFGWALWAGGFPFLDRYHPTKAHRTMEKVADKIRRTGMSILAYPEGTRNRTEVLMPFKKGPFLLALQAGIPIVPVAIEGAQRVQRRHGFSIRPGTITLTFLPTVETAGLTYGDRDTLIERVRSSIKAVLDEAEEGRT